MKHIILLFYFLILISCSKEYPEAVVKAPYEIGDSVYVDWNMGDPEFQYSWRVINEIRIIDGVTTYLNEGEDEWEACDIVKKAGKGFLTHPGVAWD